MSNLLRQAAFALVALTLVATCGLAAESDSTHYRSVSVDGVRIFYREAGNANAPAILLLHGFPSSSHMYRNLIPLLADRYRVVAPDLPGFGFSDAPDRTQFRYTFENLTNVMNRFTELVGLDRFAVYVFDYGGPIGFRMALAHPERIAAIISQNGNTYDEGLSPGFDRLKKVWVEPTEANRNTLRANLTPAANQRRYFTGVAEADKSLVAPESFTLDDTLLARPGNAEIQLDLLVDYGTNVAQFPKYQEYLRTYKPPLIAIWGRNDATFVPAGAEAFKRDDPNAEVHLLDTGHFALETHTREIADYVHGFLSKYSSRAANSLTAAQARAVIAPFYSALNAASGKDVSALVVQATSPEWVSCRGNETCSPRDKVIESVAGLHKAVPDLKWEIKDVEVTDDAVIVRGEASGTPSGEFMGVNHAGKSFRMMSIDIHTIVGGRMVRSYHVEDWMGATRQLAAK